MTYIAYGLQIESSIELPEFIRSTKTLSVTDTVQIKESRLNHRIFKKITDTNSWFDITNEVLRFIIGGVGRFEVESGSTIRFQRDSGDKSVQVSDSDIRVFLLGSCMGAILQQRKILTLHASCATFNNKAVAIAGQSGAGKSTTLACLIGADFKMISDDISAIDRTDNSFMVRPAYPQIKLNPDSTEYVSWPRSKLRWINRFRSKYARQTNDDFQPNASRISTLLILEQCKDAKNLTLNSVHGANKLTKLYEHLYRPEFHQGLKVRTPFFMEMGKLVEDTSVFTLRRPMHFSITPEQVVHQVQEALA